MRLRRYVARGLLTAKVRLESAPVTQSFYRDIFSDGFEFDKYSFNASLGEQAGEPVFAL